MPKDVTSIPDNVMTSIRRGQLTMRPRAFFVLGSVAATIGLAASIITSSFLFGLIRFSLRSHGPRGEERFAQLVSNFPWWALGVAVLGLTIGVILLRRFTFSYKRNFLLIIVIFVVAMLMSGWLLDILGLNDVLLRQGPMQGLMRGYQQSGGGRGGGPWWAQ